MAIANASISTIILAILDAVDVGMMLNSFALTAVVVFENTVLILLMFGFLLVEMILRYALISWRVHAYI